MAMSSDELEWYENVRSRVVDLVGDYAGKELFLVEGDSLLLECFRDERLDFQGAFGRRAHDSAGSSIQR